MTTKQTQQTYVLTRDEALATFELIKNRVATQKNWIASAVEAMNWDRAADLVRELRKLEKLYAKLNVEVHEQVLRWQEER